MKEKDSKGAKVSQIRKEQNNLFSFLFPSYEAKIAFSLYLHREGHILVNNKYFTLYFVIYNDELEVVAWHLWHKS